MVSTAFIACRKSQKGVHPQAREYFDKGIAAFERIISITPRNCLSRRSSGSPVFRVPRGAAIEPVQARGKEGEFFQDFRQNHLLLATAEGQLALRKNPIEAIEVAEQILNEDPYSVMGNKLLGEATLAEFYKTALFAWNS